MAQHDEDSAQQPAQAHWLIIDEFSRAEIDKAIGGLYTVLGGGDSDDRRRLPAILLHLLVIFLLVGIDVLVHKGAHAIDHVA